MSIESGFERQFYLWPFAIDHTEIDAVPEPSVRLDHVISKDPFLLRSDSREGGAGFLVEGIGLEFDPYTTELLECVTKQEVLRFCIDGCALVCGGDPGPADFKPPMGWLYIQVTGRANSGPGL
jgi:hypothetical protein